MLVGVLMLMQYICRLPGLARMMPAKPSFSAVKPPVGGGYATAGSDTLPSGPMRPFTACPGPSADRTISDGAPARGTVGRVGSMTAPAGPAGASEMTKATRTAASPARTANTVGRDRFMPGRRPYTLGG